MYSVWQFMNEKAAIKKITALLIYELNIKTPGKAQVSNNYFLMSCLVTLPLAVVI